ncbi:ribokinase-like isoform X2 [Macadamia integrifolia]|uniref:ribokinase-like isoform X2 n=1 Tax=Macadamia integrifolia TaxID=60698 RepID=UPI001C4F9B4A|nr:ribokinase-like isoform X2 [Macadamia integrifolia]
MSSSSPSYQPSPEAASASLPPLPEKRIVLGCGGVCMDFLAVVAAFPKPGDKIRSTTSKVQGGGNAANTLTCAARLGLNPRFISKVADDARGRAILEELKADGVDTSYIVAWTKAPSMPSALVSILLRLPNVKFVIVTLGVDGCIMLDRCVEEVPELEEIEVERVVELLKQKIDYENTIPTCISSKSVIRLRADGIGKMNGRLLVGTTEKIPASELIDTTGAGDAFIGAILYAICVEMPPEKMLPFAAQVVRIFHLVQIFCAKTKLSDLCLWHFLQATARCRALGA